MVVVLLANVERSSTSTPGVRAERPRSASIDRGAMSSGVSSIPQSSAQDSVVQADEGDGVGIPPGLVLDKPIVELTTAEVENLLDRLAAAEPLYWNLAPDARRLHDELTEQLRSRLGVPPPAERLAAQPDRYLERAREIQKEMGHAQ